MKNLNLLLAFVCFFALKVNAQITTPQPSPFAKVSQVVGITEVALEYSRPSVKGRKIFGDLVKFDKVWRTGANRATKITFSDSVKVEGNKLAKGDYAILTIPNQQEWTVIFSKNLGTNEQNYNEKDDVLRVKVKPTATATLIENYTMGFNNLSGSAADLELAWENTLVKVAIQTYVEEKVEKQIADFTNPAKDAGGFYAAASYYYENNKDLTKAYDWITKSTNAQPQYWTMLLKARIEHKLQKYPEAIITAEKAAEMATNAKNEQYVEMSRKLVEEAKKLVPAMPAKGKKNK